MVTEVKDLLDILVVVVEDKKHGTVLRQLRNELGDARFEDRFLHNLALSEIEVLKRPKLVSSRA